MGLVNRFEVTVTIGLYTTVNLLTATETQNKIYGYLLGKYVIYTTIT